MAVLFCNGKSMGHKKRPFNAFKFLILYSPLITLVLTFVEWINIQINMYTRFCDMTEFYVSSRP